MKEKSDKKKYYAFISYNQNDHRFASWLHRRIEQYKLPARICKKYPHLPKGKIFPICRDNLEMQPNLLWREIIPRLEESEFLIVICSPRSVNSYYVGREIRRFISLGRAERIILGIIDGIPNSKDEPQQECFHKLVRKTFRGDLENRAVSLQVKAADILFFERREYFLTQIVSRIVGLEYFDELWQRQRRRLWRRLAIYLLSVLVFIISCGVIWYIQMPFDMTITFRELTPHNERLPEGYAANTIGGKAQPAIVKLKIGEEWVEKTINDIKEPINFRDIAAKYRNVSVTVEFDNYGYVLKSPQVKLNEKVEINIARDSHYAMVKGIIYRENSRKVIPDVLVTIKGKQARSNKEGYFELSFPIEDQESVYDILLEYENKSKTIENDTYPTEKFENQLNLYFF